MKSGLHPLIVMLLLLVTIAGCDKEYSYEGGAVFSPPPITRDSTPGNDSIPVDPGALPGCGVCMQLSDTVMNTWRFNTGASQLCGRVDTAFVLNSDRSTFTFFGPAFCGTDTGLVFTVSMPPNSLTHDTGFVKADNAVFYYYHTSAPYILLSHTDQPFNLTITSYSHVTRIATGIFSGTGYRLDGRSVQVTNGRFRFYIR